MKGLSCLYAFTTSSYRMAERPEPQRKERKVGLSAPPASTVVLSFARRFPAQCRTPADRRSPLQWDPNFLPQSIALLAKEGIHLLPSLEKAMSICSLVTGFLEFGNYVILPLDGRFVKCHLVFGKG